MDEKASRLKKTFSITFKLTLSMFVKTFAMQIWTCKCVLLGRPFMMFLVNLYKEHLNIVNRITFQHLLSCWINQCMQNAKNTVQVVLLVAQMSVGMYFWRTSRSWHRFMCALNYRYIVLYTSIQIKILWIYNACICRSTCGLDSCCVRGCTQWHE